MAISRGFEDYTPSLVNSVMSGNQSYYSLLSSSYQSSSTSPTGYSISVNLSPIPFHIDELSSINSSTLIDNNTGFYDINKNDSVTTEEFSWSYCNEWTTIQQNLYQTANVIMSFAFMVPATFKQSQLLVRTLLTISYVFLIWYSSNDLCALDMLNWNILLGAINLIYTISLIRRYIPPTFTLELTELYVKVFQPLRVSKKHFQELVRDADIVPLDKGDIYAVEDASAADERLSVLISGKLRVTCDDIHLHFINTHQFIDSPEWEANHEQSDGLFQVTITAEEDAIYLCWSRMRLERVLRHRPFLKIVVDSIIGKDITQKLYSLNDHLTVLNSERAKIKENELQEIWAKATRSMSMDAVYTDPTGKVRSTSFSSAIKRQKDKFNSSALSAADVPITRLHQQCWIPILANHFSPEFPFAELQAYYSAQLAVSNATLLINTSAVDQEPSTRVVLQ